MNFRRLAVSLIIPQLAGIASMFFTAPAIVSWYENLHKPFFSPPNWLFGPVWIFLYFLMGISVYIVWQNRSEELHDGKAKEALWVFWIHLLFNAAWSPIFFGLKSPGWAFVNIVIILVFIIYLIRKFGAINKNASRLLVPYFLWISFATVLNGVIWYLN